MAIQTSYTRTPDIGFPGMLARGFPPPVIVNGYAQVDANERKPRPGDAVIWDTTNHAFKVPGSGEGNLIVGIVTYSQSDTPTAVPSTDDVAVQYSDGDTMQVVIQGMVYLAVTTSTTPVNFRERLSWDVSTAVNAQAAWGRAIAQLQPGGVPSLAQLYAADALTTIRSFDKEQVAANSTRKIVTASVNI